MGSTPVGKTPPWSVISDGPGVVPPTGCWVASRKMPMSMKTTSAATLTIANQNSSSPKIRTEIRLTVSTTASAMSAITHCGTSVNSRQ